MERQEYQVLVDRYSNMSKRFKRGRKIGWIMLLMEAAVIGACLIVVADSDSIFFEISCKGYCFFAMLAALYTNIKLIFMNKWNFTEVDMALYCVINVGMIMGSIELILMGIIAYDAMEIALWFLVVDIVVCIGFWITVDRYNRKKMMAGGYCLRNNAIEKPWKTWLWGLTALPFIPLMTLAGRKIWLVSLGDTVQVVLIMYMLLWFWLVLIYTLFAPSVFFISLERKFKRQNENKEKMLEMNNVLSVHKSSDEL